jgi:hypothetical protein
MLPQSYVWPIGQFRVSLTLARARYRRFAYRDFLQPAGSALPIGGPCHALKGRLGYHCLRGSSAMVLAQQGFTGFSYPRTLVTAGMDCSQRGSTGHHRRSLRHRKEILGES